ncbi:pectin lyase-like protein [Penicillium angulare]|uniref:pectin lyase-like protein n=1 Tax=Penicillium angulare TaxID=116970 RepID=UPI00253F9FEE|nr:pectin lyase-like protein [Penicillium angulare]KAJ5291569.1 pectin lyase-like protein [Penicillium angulare]
MDTINLLKGVISEFMRVLQMMQSSPYSYYSSRYKYNLETFIENCGITANTTIPDDIAVT